MTDNTDTTIDATPNPYNARKEWDTEEVEQRGFVSADDALGSIADFINDEDEEIVEEIQEEPNPSGDEEEEIAKARSKQYKKPNWKKRYDDSRRLYERKRVEWEEEKARILEQARSQRPTYVPPKTPEELATFREENPDIYDIVDSVAHMRAEERIAQLNGEIDNLKKTQVKSAHKEAKEQLLRLHPDFNEITASSEFHDWASAQPKQIQDWVYRNSTNASLAARAIDLYKQDQGIVEKEQQTKKVKDTKDRKQHKSEERANAAEAVSVAAKPEPKSSNERIWTTSEIARLSIAEYEQFKDEIDKANNEGRIKKG